MSDRQTLVRKITLYPVGDKIEVNRVYSYIRNGMEVYSQMMNMCLSAMYAAKLSGADKDEMRKLSQHYSHVPNSKKGSPYKYDMSKYPTGLPLAGTVPHNCKQILSKSIKDGLLYGKVSLPTIKNTCPMPVHNTFLNIRGSKTRSNGAIINTGFYHEYTSESELYNALALDKNPHVYLKFANDITFEVVFGNVHQSSDIRDVFEKIFNRTYDVCDSSIGFDKKSGKKIELNLTLSIPKREVKLDGNTVVGVDLGMAMRVVCTLNNDMYTRLAIGSYEDFTKKRMQMAAERRRIQKTIKQSKGGHGRAKKCAHLDKLTRHEREWVHTYSHNLSRQVVNFALKHNAKYINLECLKGISQSDKKEFVLRYWSYYELQQMIESKAAQYGIVVRYINPAYTSQTCSVCGQKGLRPEQAKFVCTNPDCKSHTMYTKGFNADFNASRNIAMSVDFVSNKPVKLSRKKSSDDDKHVIKTA